MNERILYRFVCTPSHRKLLENPLDCDMVDYIHIGEQLFAKFIGLVVFFSVLLVPRIAKADGQPVIQTIGPFSGLNNQDSSFAIPNSNAQDLLNVDITPAGRSIKKRHGFSLDATLNYSTSAVHNGYHFFNASGNDVRLWMNDVDVSVSVNNLPYTVLVSSNITVGSTMDCADSQGSAWCVDSNNDQVFRTDGLTVTWFPSHPKGTVVTASPTRLAIANVSGNANSIYFSASGDYTNETVGSQTASPFVESILAPGSHITHLRYWNGRYLFWKDQSFGYVIGDDQFSAQIVIVSTLIGTLDNASVENEGLIYFRGQDNHIWVYDGANLSRLTREITPIVLNDNKRKNNSWTQTIQTDFQAGSIVPTGWLSTSISPGNVIQSTFGVTSSVVDFNNGTFSNTNVNVSSQVVLTINNSGTITDPSFEGTYGTNFKGSGGSFVASYAGTCTLNPQNGSKFLVFNNQNVVNKCNPALTVAILDTNGNMLDSKTETVGNSCTWSSDTFASTANSGKRVSFRFDLKNDDCLGNVSHSSSTTNSTYIFGGSVSFFYTCLNNTVASPDATCAFDNVSLGSSTITSGTWTSQTYDTGFTSVTVQINSLGTTLNTEAIATELRHSTASGGPFTDLGAIGVNLASNRYVQILATFTATGADNAVLSSLNNFSMGATSSGTYYSAVNNAPNLTSWGTLTIDDMPNVSSITYFTRSSTNSFSVLSATPAWVYQNKNATVAASTGTYMQLRADFYAGSGILGNALNDFTFNWFEGTAADQAYATYFDFGIWWSVSYSTAATTNNRILRLDLLNNTWTIYDIAANGFLVLNNLLYFGDPVNGKVYVYANGAESDNGSAINSFWKSKDFTNLGPNIYTGLNPTDSPFNEKDFRTLSTFATAQSTGTLNVTYTYDQTTSGLFNFPMNDPNGLNLLRKNYYLPQGTRGTSFNVKYGNNAAAQPWEVLGGMFTYDPKPWRVYP